MGAVLTWTLVFSLWKKFTSTWNQTTSRNPLQSSHCFAWFSIVHWETCFWVCFCSSYDISFSSKDRESVILRLTMRWCLMRMSTIDYVPLILLHETKLVRQLRRLLIATAGQEEVTSSLVFICRDLEIDGQRYKSWFVSRRLLSNIWLNYFITELHPQGVGISTH